MKIRTIVVSILTIFLLIVAGLYVKSREQENKNDSKIQRVTKEEVEERIR